MHYAILCNRVSIELLLRIGHKVAYRKAITISLERGGQRKSGQGSLQKLPCMCDRNNKGTWKTRISTRANNTPDRQTNKTMSAAFAIYSSLHVIT